MISDECIPRFHKREMKIAGKCSACDMKLMKTALTPFEYIRSRHPEIKNMDQIEENYNIHQCDVERENSIAREHLRKKHLEKGPEYISPLKKLEQEGTKFIDCGKPD